MTSALSKFLRPGGHLIVVDFSPGGEVHPDEEAFKHIIAHREFSEEDMRACYEAGQIELKKYGYAFDMTFRGLQRKCFCALGQKKLLN
jgi:hypothetical protein